MHSYHYVTYVHLTFRHRDVNPGTLLLGCGNKLNDWLLVQYSELPELVLKGQQFYPVLTLYHQCIGQNSEKGKQVIMMKIVVTSQALTSVLETYRSLQTTPWDQLCWSSVHICMVQVRRPALSAPGKGTAIEAKYACVSSAHVILVRTWPLGIN